MGAIVNLIAAPDLAALESDEVSRRRVSFPRSEEQKRIPTKLLYPNKEGKLDRFVVPEMNTKVKGLLKGLRYISQIFDGKEEQEMQIGFPTDVKHVAHIGWDGPSVNGPSWMNEFHSAPLSASIGADGREAVASPKSVSQEFPINPLIKDAAIRDPSSPKTRRSRRHASSSDAPGSESQSPNHDHSQRGSRHSRRHQSAGSVTTDSPTRDPPADGSRRGRRHSKPADPAATAGSDASSSQELPSIPKQSRRPRKTTKGPSESGSSRSSGRTNKAPNSSLSEPGAEEKSARTVEASTPAAEEAS